MSATNQCTELVAHQERIGMVLRLAESRGERLVDDIVLARRHPSAVTIYCRAERLPLEFDPQLIRRFAVVDDAAAVSRERTAQARSENDDQHPISPLHCPASPTPCDRQLTRRVSAHVPCLRADESEATLGRPAAIFCQSVIRCRVSGRPVAIFSHSVTKVALLSLPRGHFRHSAMQGGSALSTTAHPGHSAATNDA
jgi:ribosomal protein S14